MPGILVYLPFFFLAVCTLAHTTVPLFLWSGEGYFGNMNNHHPEADGLLQLDHFMHDFMNVFAGKKNVMADSLNVQDSLMTYIPKPNEIKPEVVVAFIYSKLDSAEAARQSGAYSSANDDGMSLSFLKNALIKSKSSLTVPHILIEDASTTSTSAQMADMFSTLSPKPEIVALELKDKENEIDHTDGINQNLAGCRALLKHLDENEWIFSNLVTDLIMIKADDFKDVQEECVEALMGRVSSLTAGHFVAMLTADMAKRDITKFFPTPLDANLNSFSAQGMSERHPILLAAQGQNYVIMATDNNWPGVRYLSSNILFGLFLGGFIFLVVACGINCLLMIETPQRLSSRRYAVGKQS